MRMQVEWKPRAVASQHRAQLGIGPAACQLLVQAFEDEPLDLVRDLPDPGKRPRLVPRIPDEEDRTPQSFDALNWIIEPSRVAFHHLLPLLREARRFDLRNPLLEVSMRRKGRHQALLPARQLFERHWTELICCLTLRINLVDTSV